MTAVVSMLFGFKILQKNNTHENNGGGYFQF